MFICLFVFFFCRFSHVFLSLALPLFFTHCFVAICVTAVNVVSIVTQIHITSAIFESQMAHHSRWQTKTNHCRLLSRTKRIEHSQYIRWFYTTEGRKKCVCVDFSTIIYLYAPNRNRIWRQIRIFGLNKYMALFCPSNDNTFCYTSTAP